MVNEIRLSPLQQFYAKANVTGTLCNRYPLTFMLLITVINVIGCTWFIMKRAIGHLCGVGWIMKNLIRTCMIYVISKESNHTCVTKGDPMHQLLLYGNFSHKVYGSTAVHVPLSTWSDTTFDRCWNTFRSIIQILITPLINKPRITISALCASLAKTHFFLITRMYTNRNRVMAFICSNKVIVIEIKLYKHSWS